MKKMLLVPVLVCVLPLAAIAQEHYPKAEIFGGYSYLRANDPLSFVDLNLQGWNASFSGNISNWFGIVGDVSGHYGSPTVFGFGVPFLDVNTHSVLFGPGLSYRSDKIAPFAHFLIGTTRASAGAFGLSYSRNALSAAVGGGIDLRINNNFAVRVFQADYLMTRFYDERQNNLRLSAGIVVLLGNH
jgi:opacity protein-like surface antigen